MHRRPWLRVLALAALFGCGERTAPAPVREPSSPPLPSGAEPERSTTAEPSPYGPHTIDLLPWLRQGSLSVAGTVLDLGEAQAARFLVAPTTLHATTLNGDSWALLGPRLRLRVPVDLEHPPNVLRLRVRRAQARVLVVSVDRAAARQVRIAVGSGPTIVTVPLPPERFRRAEAELELRFLGITRAPPPTHVVEAGARLASEPAVAEVDWLHLVREEDAAHPTAVQRASDLLADVRAGGEPRRSLTLFSPGALQLHFSLGRPARLRAALAAQGPSGAAAGTVQATLRVEADGRPAVEVAQTLTAGEPWHDVDVDLSPLQGRPVRLSLRAERGRDNRVALGEPRLVFTPHPARATTTPRRALVVVLRGARADRFLPQLSTRFTGQGFERALRDSARLLALGASYRPVAALASVLTGLPAELHRVQEYTDTLNEGAPTLADALRDAGVATALFTDDAWVLGSGLDRGFGEAHGCPGDAGQCRSEGPLTEATDWLLSQRDRRSVAVVVTRAGTAPYDPPPDLLSALDTPGVDQLVLPEVTATWSARSREGHPALSPLDAPRVERVGQLYDAALEHVDRSLATALDRLREGGLLEDSALALVGDRGQLLGEQNLVGDGPPGALTPMRTVLALRVPGGLDAELLEQPVSTLDLAATLRDLFGAAEAPWRGCRSLLRPGELGLHPSGVSWVAGPRGELALSMGDTWALPRNGALALVDAGADPLGATDLAAQRPLTLAFAQEMLSQRRNLSPAQAAWSPHTRALPQPVEHTLRSSQRLRR